MRAFRGVIEEGRVVLPEGVRLPEGAVVTVTIGEAEYIRATLRAALRRNGHRRSRGRPVRPVYTPSGVAVTFAFATRGVQAVRGAFAPAGATAGSPDTRD